MVASDQVGEDVDELEARRMLGSGEVVHDSERARSFAAVAQALELDAEREPGPRKIGRFVVIERVGAGATASVYAAYDPQLDRKVALKTLRNQWSGAPGERERRERLQREARALARLRHPAVVTIHDVGTHEGQLYIAMELVDGLTLGEWLTRTQRDWSEVLEIFAQAGRGLAAAHAADVVHRDFKPDNVVIDGEGQARVVDFGLAGPLASVEPTGASRNELSVTRTGAIVGTPAYLAPECFAGDVGTPASDQFSFCVALFEALYGTRPFPGDDLLTLEQNVSAGELREVRGRGVPAWLLAVVRTGLSLDPRARHPDMGVLVDRLERGRSRRRVRGYVGAAALAIAAGSGLAAASADEVCAAPTDALGEVWSPEDALRVQDAFAETSLAFAPQTALRTVAALDAWAGDWSTAWAQTCESDEALARRQRACLDSTLAGADALVELLAQADEKVVTEAVSAADGLRDPDDCLSPLFSAADHTQSSARDADLQALRDDIERGYATGRAGDYTTAIGILEDASARGEALDYGPLHADALVALGAMRRMNHQPMKARRDLEAGFFLAQRSRHDPAAIEGALQLAQVVIQGEGSLERGELWLAHAESLLGRWPEHPQMQARLTATRAGVLGRAGMHDEAIATYTQAIEQQSAIDGEDAWTTGILYQQRGAFELGTDAKTGDASIARASEIFEATLGPDHPATANAIRARVAAQLGLKNIERALELSQDSVDRLERAFGDQHPEVASAYVNHAIALYQNGEHERGMSYFERSLAIYEASLGPESQHVATATHNLGSAYGGIGEPEKSLHYHELGLERSIAVFGPEHRAIANSQWKVGVALFNAGRVSEALTRFETAERIAKATGEGATLRAQILSALGATRLEMGEHDAARDAYERALDLTPELDEPNRPAHRGHMLTGLAEVDNAAHDFPAAVEHANAALSALEEHQQAAALVQLGHAQLELREYAAAEQTLQRALALFEANGGDTLGLAATRWTLARTLAKQRKDPPRQRQLAEQATADYETAGRSDEAAEARAWLARR